MSSGICNCTTYITNPDACKTCTVRDSGNVLEKKIQFPSCYDVFTPLKTEHIIMPMTPERVREIVREEIADAIAEVADGHPNKVRSDILRTIQDEMNNYRVDIDDDTLIQLIDRRIKAALARLSRLLVKV